ncbi:MAG: nuclear transport factor 2 family protein [Acidobacteria bacterium]|nr:nuclear transport factor 2 family protein [Acidobacteriota bacterium]
MNPSSAESVVREFWRLMGSNDFSSVGAVLSPSFSLEWPQSNERIRGADTFARMNAEYPSQGPWSFTVLRLVASGTEAVTRVAVTDGHLSAEAISFFTVSEGLITKVVEFWPEPYPAPAHRKHLTEPLAPAP